MSRWNMKAINFVKISSSNSNNFVKYGFFPVFDFISPHLSGVGLCVAY